MAQEWTDAGKLQAAYDVGEREAKAAFMLATDVDPTICEELNRMVQKLGQSKRNNLGTCHPIRLRSQGLKGFFACWQNKGVSA